MILDNGVQVGGGDPRNMSLFCGQNVVHTKLFSCAGIHLGRLTLFGRGGETGLQICPGLCAELTHKATGPAATADVDVQGQRVEKVYEMFPRLVKEAGRVLFSRQFGH